jgi:hypothetical protein
MLLQSLLLPLFNFNTEPLRLFLAKNEKLQLARLIHCMLIRVPAAHSIQPIPGPTVPSVELSSMKAATKDFHKNNIIGRGGFGIVYEVNISHSTHFDMVKILLFKVCAITYT